MPARPRTTYAGATKRSQSPRPVRGGTVVATPAADELIMRLRAGRSCLALRPRAEARSWELPREVRETSLPCGLNDLQLGEIGGVPFLIDADEYKGWGYPSLLVDVGPAGNGFFRSAEPDSRGLALHFSR